MQNNATQVKTLALLIHSVTASETNEQNLAVMAHDVYHQGDQSILGAGRAFTTTDKRNLLEILSNDTSADMEFLEARCLASGKESLMWFRPRQKTTVDILGKSYTVPLPSLVFLLHKQNLYIAAYKGDKRPERDTKLLVSGLPNVGTRGAWCSGGNGLPAHPNQSHIDRIEEVFFLSPFTHFNGAAADLEVDEDAASRKSLPAYFGLLVTKRQFPVSKLKPMKSDDFRRDDLDLHTWFSKITKG